jgi:hypothetical protein
MPQEDRLQKQINLLGRMLGKILSDLIGIGSQNKVGASVEIVQQALKGELNIDLDEILRMSPDEVVAFLTTKKQFTEPGLEAFADILYQLALESGKESSNKLSEKALSLYESVNKTSRTYSVERQAKIDKIKYSS